MWSLGSERNIMNWTHLVPVNCVLITLKKMLYTRKSWLSKYDIRLEFLILKMFLVLQYGHIIHPFKDEAL